MSFMNRFSRGFKGAAAAVRADEYLVQAKKAKCIHCGGEQFECGEALLNTAAMSFLNLDWANKSASILICKRCSYIMWFASAPQKIL